MAKLDAIRALRPRIVEHLPTFNLTRFDNLETLALALFYAQGAYLVVSRPKSSLEELGARGVLLRRILLSDADTQVLRKGFEKEILDEIRKGSGYRDLGEDLMALVLLYRGRWEVVGKTTGISQAELEEAEALSPLLVVGAEKRELEQAIRGKVVEDRERAFALLVEAYNAARRAALYLCEKEKEANEIAPSLYAGRGNRPPGDTDEEMEDPSIDTDEPTLEDALPVGENVSPGTSATAGNTPGGPSNNRGDGAAGSSLSTKVGMPDSNPFTE